MVWWVWGRRLRYGDARVHFQVSSLSELVSVVQFAETGKALEGAGGGAEKEKHWFFQAKLRCL